MKFLKVLGTILLVLFIVALVAFLILFFISVAKNMNFVDFWNSIFKKTATPKSSIGLGLYAEDFIKTFIFRG